MAALPMTVEVWDRLPSEVQALILGLQAEVERLQAKVKALHAQAQDLRAQLNQNSTNSSRPPSTDLPTLKRAPPRSPSGRRPGGQPGHEPQQRPFLPTAHTQGLRPTKCR